MCPSGPGDRPWHRGLRLDPGAPSSGAHVWAGSHQGALLGDPAAAEEATPKSGRAGRLPTLAFFLLAILGRWGAGAAGRSDLCGDLCPSAPLHALFRSPQRPFVGFLGVGSP